MRRLSDTVQWGVKAEVKVLKHCRFSNRVEWIQYDPDEQYVVELKRPLLSLLVQRHPRSCLRRPCQSRDSDDESLSDTSVGSFEHVQFFGEPEEEEFQWHLPGTIPDTKVDDDIISEHLTGRSSVSSIESCNVDEDSCYMGDTNSAASASGATEDMSPLTSCDSRIITTQRRERASASRSRRRGYTVKGIAMNALQMLKRSKSSTPKSSRGDTSASCRAQALDVHSFKKPCLHVPSSEDTDEDASTACGSSPVSSVAGGPRAYDRHACDGGLPPVAA